MIIIKFRYKQITNKRQFSSKKRSHKQIKWIVIHYTGNYSAGANALAHYNYLQHATRQGSAHYYVDDKEIIQTIGDSRIAWSVGDNQGRGRYLNGCTNANSLSIEMCVNKDSDQNKTYKNVLELTKNLMKKFNINADHVCRHYDVSRKNCPANFRKNNWELWWKFKSDIKQPILWKMDLSKDSTFGVDNGKNIPPTKVHDVENLKAQDEERQAHLKKINSLSSWAEDAWEWAVKNEITDGKRPGANCTREEVVTLIFRAYSLKRWAYNNTKKK